MGLTDKGEAVYNPKRTYPRGYQELGHLWHQGQGNFYCTGRPKDVPEATVNGICCTTD